MLREMIEDGGSGLLPLWVAGIVGYLTGFGISYSLAYLRHRADPDRPASFGEIADKGGKVGAGFGCFGSVLIGVLLVLFHDVDLTRGFWIPNLSVALFAALAASLGVAGWLVAPSPKPGPGRTTSASRRPGSGSPAEKALEEMRLQQSMTVPTSAVKLTPSPPFPRSLAKARQLAESAERVQGSASRDRADAYHRLRTPDEQVRAMGLFLVAVGGFHRAAQMWAEALGLMLLGGLTTGDPETKRALEQLAECERGRSGIVYDYEESLEDRKGMQGLAPQWKALAEYAPIRTVAEHGLEAIVGDLAAHEILGRQDSWGMSFPWTEVGSTEPAQQNLGFDS